jgi:hypothetical protein
MSQTTLDSAPRTQVDLTYDSVAPINAAEYEVVRSYFKDMSNSDTIAGNFTLFLFRIADMTGYNVLTLLDDVKGKTNLEINATMAYYLNSVKSKTTLYGVSVSPQPNQVTQRNIVI